MVLTDGSAVMPTAQMRILRLRSIRGCSKGRNRGRLKRPGLRVLTTGYCQEVQGLEIRDTGDNVVTYTCNPWED